MKLEAAELLCNYGGEIHEDYSGRGMYGKETTGIVFDDDKEFYKAIAGVMEDTIQDQNFTECELIVEALKSIRTDNMGTGIIFY